LGGAGDQGAEAVNGSWNLGQGRAGWTGDVLAVGACVVMFAEGRGASAGLAGGGDEVAGLQGIGPGRVLGFD